MFFTKKDKNAINAVFEKIHREITFIKEAISAVRAESGSVTKVVYETFGQIGKDMDLVEFRLLKLEPKSRIKKVKEVKKKNARK